MKDYFNLYYAYLPSLTPDEKPAAVHSFIFFISMRLFARVYY
jgi:hypothetical protein